MNPILPNADDPRGGTTSELRQIIDNCRTLTVSGVYVTDPGKLLALLADQKQRWEATARKDELRMCLKSVPMPTLSYEQVENRIAELEGQEQ